MAFCQMAAPMSPVASFVAASVLRNLRSGTVFRGRVFFPLIIVSHLLNMGAVSRTYLLCYNLVQCGLWIHTLYLLAKHILSHLGLLTTDHHSAVASLYSLISPSALLSQRLSWLEVLHAAVGLVGGGVGAAFIQALGRSAVLLVLVEVCATARASLAAPLLIAAAAPSDLARYAFYVAGLLQSCPQWLLVLRYSVFLFAYPVGICCEWLLYFVSLDEVDARGVGRVVLPNAWNFAFDYGVWNRGVLVSYVYFGPSMFLYMWQQRRKKLAVAMVDVAGSVNKQHAA